MSISQKGVRALQRAAGTTPDVGTLNQRLDSIERQVAAQSAAIAQLLQRLDNSPPPGLTEQFDSVAAAQAEGMVYLNRSLRDIRAELLRLNSSVGELRASDSAEQRRD